ncbi:MAG: hypothetical protein H6526_08770 [Actinobacteria bacterium]|nr:hypothetical protein [Actinomycetota bacterium]MCB8996545.1 hypothetical protein [Actinomycetota bacterium]MCB9415364.1 hypothetical protein [Actinomycetota bacterium]HRY08561.1 hypothetical protein [Candidatus Nanopelagicales bacterium]
MRWTLIASLVVLAGCQQMQPAPHPTTLPGPVAAGRPEAPIMVADQDWAPCTGKQMRKYPPVLDEPASTYYAGPWCQDADGGTRFMWMYAEPLFPGETPEEVRGYVNEDASLLVRGLRTTGYQPVRAGQRGDDVFYEARRPTSENLVSVAVLGDDVPPEGQAYAGDNPLRVVVAVRKAGPDDTPSPSRTPSP